MENSTLVVPRLTTLSADAENTTSATATEMDGITEKISTHMQTTVGYANGNTGSWPNATDFLQYGNVSGIYTPNGTGNITHGFDSSMCDFVKEVLRFDDLQLIRVIITWVLFVISLFGNSFVLSCVYKKAKTSHVHLIMLHFTLADLAFTLMVMPNDAIWNTTMEWKVGEFLCRLCQMLKQIGMYISSFMVVVLALDRCCSILQPMSTPQKQRKRTKYLVGGAWILSILSAIPPAIIFTVKAAPLCPDRPPFLQCVDFVVVPNPAHRRPYYFFTMFMSFILPMIFTAVSYSLVVCEISNMMERDRVMMGRRDSCHTIMRARKKTLFITSMVTLSFLCFWGPYYGFAIYDWFDKVKQTPGEVTTVLFLLMYVHPAIHPILYGVLMKDVRVQFGRTMSRLEQIITCKTTETKYGEKTLNCLSSTRRIRGSGSNGYVRTECRRDIPGSTGDEPDYYGGRNSSATDGRRADEIERRKLISGENDGTFEPPAGQDAPMGRRSTVTFKLSDSVPAKEAVWNNNNEKLPDLGSDDSVFKSTIL